MKRQYGFRPSPPDVRDKRADPTGLVIKDFVDLSQNPAMPAVFDQLELGSCTSNAVGACLQFDMSLDRRLQGLGNAHRRSRLDLYYGERELEGELGQGDTGAIGRDGFKFAQQTGVLLEKVWPYTDAPDGPGSYEGPPPAGRRHKLTKPYASVAKSEDAIRAVLSNNQLVAFGFTVFESFESETVAETGVVPMPRSGEQDLGGHEVVVVGYGQDGTHVKVRNSWGSGWGMGGYCLFPWDYLLGSFTSDLRTIVRASY